MNKRENGRLHLALQIHTVHHGPCIQLNEKKKAKREHSAGNNSVWFGNVSYDIVLQLLLLFPLLPPSPPSPPLLSFTHICLAFGLALSARGTGIYFVYQFIDDTLNIFSYHRWKLKILRIDTFTHSIRMPQDLFISKFNADWLTARWRRCKNC